MMMPPGIRIGAHGQGDDERFVVYEFSASRAAAIPVTRTRSSTDRNGHRRIISAARSEPMWMIRSSSDAGALLMSTHCADTSGTRQNSNVTTKAEIRMKLGF